MSNTMVGGVYQKIMDEVIENCVVTFEEDGVERKLLDEVKKTWQSKLSERKVAIMPWDPAPAPPSAPQATSKAASQTNSQPVVPSSVESVTPKPTTPTPANASSNASGTAIKSEPGTGSYDLQNLPQSNGMASNYGSSGAALDRTSQQLHDKFGAAAGPQISQLQARRAMMNQNAPQQAQASASDLEAKRRMYEMQQAQRHKAQIAAQQQQQQRALGSAQTDGPSDWSSLVAERRAAAAVHGEAADHTLRQLLEASSQEMEGGGLLQPVSQRTSTPSSARIARMRAHASTSIGQYDGPDDSDDDKGGVKEEDDEAINSDLDDPEDELDDDETDEDANQGEIMLCTYDKVQRVKNKWKCTLKDGVLTTGGKEYVFHKAQGEFEW